MALAKTARCNSSGSKKSRVDQACWGEAHSPVLDCTGCLARTECESTEPAAWATFWRFPCKGEMSLNAGKIRPSIFRETKVWKVWRVLQVQPTSPAGCTLDSLVFQRGVFADALAKGVVAPALVDKN